MTRRITQVSVWMLAAAVAGAGCERVAREPPSPPVEEASRPEAVEPRAPRGDAVEHTVRFPEPHTHYLEVQSIFPTEGGGELVVFLPVWTPGSYLVREHARHVEALEASTPEGQPLEATKSRKNRWTIATGGAARVVIRYRLYARELSVRTNFVDSELAVLNGASTFLGVVGRLDRPQDLLLHPPEGWAESVTALRPHPGGAPHHYLAADYDELVDSPVVLGVPALHRFEVDGTEHVLATFGEAGVWDGARAARDLETLVRAQIAFWGGAPYDRYVFLNVLGGGGGGLEHMRSTLVLASPFATRDRDEYRSWLGLMSHELFHAWNGKRLRPAELGPFDYENEVYTRDLWIVEGITSYYDDVLLVRAGLLPLRRYLDRLSKSVASLQAAPGREVQSLAEASYDAWIKYYRPDENAANARISYYRKGAVVAFLLDARIRRATGAQRSLDDVMRLAHERFGGERGFTTAQFRELATEVAGTSLDAFFDHAVEGTGELDYADALDWYGLRFRREEPPRRRPDEEVDEPPGWLGASVASRGGRLIVTEVERGTPAHQAGINVDDELIAIGEHRVPPEGLSERLARYRPGEEVSVLLSRRGRLHRVAATLGEAPEALWDLELVRAPTASQRRHLEQWLPIPRPVTAPLAVDDASGE